VIWENRLSEDPRRIKLAGLVRRGRTSDRRKSRKRTQGLAVNATVQNARSSGSTSAGRKGWTFGPLAQSSERKRVGIARHNGELKQLAEGVHARLLVALPFAIVLSLAIGVILSVLAFNDVSQT